MTEDKPKENREDSLSASLVRIIGGVAIAISLILISLGLLGTVIGGPGKTKNFISIGIVLFVGGFLGIQATKK